MKLKDAHINLYSVYRDAVYTKYNQVTKIINYLNERGINVTSTEESIISYTHNDPKEISIFVKVSDEEYKSITSIKLPTKESK